MYWLLSPLAWLLLAGAVLVWSLLRRRPLATVLAVGVIALAVALMTPIVSNALTSSLEQPFGDANGCAHDPPSTAVVLGGGLDGTPRDDADFSVLNLSSRLRVDRAVAWWREGEGRTLVMQGGANYGGAPALAQLMAAYARELGVPSTAIHTETGSGDTWENAIHAAKIAPPLPRRVVLVTSLIHLERARVAYTRNGFEVCPLGTDMRRLPSRIPWALVPRTSALEHSEAALHEWAGLAYYRWRSHAEPTANGR